MAKTKSKVSKGGMIALGAGILAVAGAGIYALTRTKKAAAAPDDTAEEDYRTIPHDTTGINFSLSGTVSTLTPTSGAPTPLGGVTVAVGTAKATTGSDGKYILPNLSSPTPVITVIGSKEGYTTQNFPVTIQAGPNTLDFNIVLVEYSGGGAGRSITYVASLRAWAQTLLQDGHEWEAAYYFALAGFAEQVGATWSTGQQVPDPTYDALWKLMNAWIATRVPSTSTTPDTPNTPILPYLSPGSGLTPAQQATVTTALNNGDVWTGQYWYKQDGTLVDPQPPNPNDGSTITLPSKEATTMDIPDTGYTVSSNEPTVTTSNPPSGATDTTTNIINTVDTRPPLPNGWWTDGFDVYDENSIPTGYAWDYQGG